MSNLKATFEKELKTRLAQKAKPNQPEDVLLIKGMKYFDLNNSGTVSRDEFGKALQRLGINSYDESQISQLFEIYDADQSGELDYKEFSCILFGGTNRSPVKVSKKIDDSPQLQQQQQQKSIESKQAIPGPDNPAVAQSLQTLKDTLKRRGTIGIVDFARMFRVIDDNNNKRIEFEEFYKVLNDYKIELPLVQVQKLFAYFDKDRSGTIDYDELLVGIRGELNPARKALVAKAFDKLDKTGNGEIDLDDLQGVYNASKHPDVIQGKKSQEEILQEFLRTFESYSYYRGKVDNVVTREEFEDYYAFISASIDLDQYFAAMMTSAWKLDQTSSSQEENKSNELVVNDYSQLEGNIGFMLKRLRQRLATRGAKAFIQLHKILRTIDANKDGKITQPELFKALKENRLEVADQDSLALVEHYDTTGSGEVPIEALMHDLLGNYTQFRRETVNQAWNTLNGSANDKVDLGTLKNAFKGQRNHPDAKSGRKTDMQITDEYNETWDLFRSYVSGARTDYVTKQEFENYFLCYSATIEDDDYFRAVVHETFKIRPESRQSSWAGYPGGGKKDYDPQASYAQNMHKSQYQGGSVISQAPFGTSQAHFNPYHHEEKPTPKKVSTKWVESPSPAQQSNANDEMARTRKVQQEQSNIFSGVSDKDLFEVLRKKILARGARGILAIARVFRNMDDDNSKTISFQEFEKALKDFRINVVEEDAKKIFNYMDYDKSGSINYDEFLRAIKGEMNESRMKNVIEVFERLDKDKNGFLTIEDIKDLYNAKQHPDVKTGKKTEDDILMEFLETFEQHHATMTKTAKDKRVSLNEFIEYYNNISCSIDDDRYFEMMMNNCWLPNKNSQRSWKNN
jgi:Ca2+-binding EF-hand superfamily protein